MTNTGLIIMGMWIGTGILGSSSTDAGATMFMPFIATVGYWIFTAVTHFKGK